MAQLMRSGYDPETKTTAFSSSASKRKKVKVENVYDSVEGESAPLNKRYKTASQAVDEVLGGGTNAFPVPAPLYNPLDEPSPLGLRLRKSPSLLDLIQMRLSQSNNVSTPGSQKIEEHNNHPKKENKSTSIAISGTTDKIKASNFPGSILKIGRWEYKSRYEGDLVAKCYFAKHKLVWEILDGSLKSKIEIQWSDIVALKANYPDNEPGTLNVVLARQPLFFRETNPQPRKHTLWQATADFTNGQASIHRQHFLQCPPGLLNRHFEKLIQCDMRLNFLSQQPEISLDSPYFGQRASVFEDPVELKNEDYGQLVVGKGSPVSSSLVLAKGDPVGTSSEHMSHEASSPSSDTLAMETRENCEVVDSKGPRSWNQIKVPGLHPSMSMSDLMNHIGNCISEQMTSGNPSISAGGSECQAMLEDIAQYLLSDTQLATSSDEKRLMARVNSLYCLLQKEGSTQNFQALGESYPRELENEKGVQLSQTCGLSINNKDEASGPEQSMKDDSGIKQGPGMSRKDSFGDLLLNLPRIASLPKFLFDISEDDGESQAR